MIDSNKTYNFDNSLFEINSNKLSKINKLNKFANLEFVNIEKIIDEYFANFIDGNFKVRLLLNKVS